MVWRFEPPSRVMTSVGPLHLSRASRSFGHGRGPPSVLCGYPRASEIVLGASPLASAWLHHTGRFRVRGGREGEAAFADYGLGRRPPPPRAPTGPSSVTVGRLPRSFAAARARAKSCSPRSRSPPFGPLARAVEGGSAFADYGLGRRPPPRASRSVTVGRLPRSHV